MKRNAHLLSILLMIVMICSMISMVRTSTTYAQEDDLTDEALARVDDVLAHLSGYLGQTITRDSHYWTWAENLYDNIAMDCPVEGQTYAPETTRGFRIVVMVDEAQYDYRISADGGVLILCSEEGEPNAASVGIDVPQSTSDADADKDNNDDKDITDATPEDETADDIEVTESPDSEIVVEDGETLSLSTDWAWLYNAEADTLNLFNVEGLVIELPRPPLSDELIVNEQPTVHLGVSRDGRRMLMASKRIDSAWNIGIYDFALGTFIQTHISERGEELMMNATNTAQISSPNSQYMAVSLVMVDDENGGQTSWRILDFNMETGDLDFELRSDNASVLGAQITAPIQINSPSTFPAIAFYDNNAIYYHLQPYGADATPTPPGYRWQLQTGNVQYWNFATTVYDRSFNSNQVVFAYQDKNAPFLSISGASLSNNRIGTRDLLGGGTQNIVEDGTVALVSVVFAGADNLMVFEMYDGSRRQWLAINTDTDRRIELSSEVTDVVGSESGFYSLGTDGIRYHSAIAPETPDLIFENDVSDWQIIWTLPPNNIPFGLTQITLPA